MSKKTKEQESAPAANDQTGINDDAFLPPPITPTGPRAARPKGETIVSGATFWDFDKKPVFMGTFTGKEILREKDGKNAATNPNEKAGSVMGYEFKDVDGNIHLLGASYSITKVFGGAEGKKRAGVVMYIEFEGQEPAANGKPAFNRFHIQTVAE